MESVGGRTSASSCIQHVSHSIFARFFSVLVLLFGVLRCVFARHSQIYIQNMSVNSTVCSAKCPFANSNILHASNSHYFKILFRAMQRLPGIARAPTQTEDKKKTQNGFSLFRWHRWEVVAYSHVTHLRQRGRRGSDPIFQSTSTSSSSREEKTLFSMQFCPYMCSELFRKLQLTTAISPSFMQSRAHDRCGWASSFTMHKHIAHSQQHRKMATAKMPERRRRRHHCRRQQQFIYLELY